MGKFGIFGECHKMRQSQCVKALEGVGFKEEGCAGGLPCAVGGVLGHVQEEAVDEIKVVGFTF